MQQDFDTWYKSCIDFTSYYSKGLPVPSSTSSSLPPPSSSSSTAPTPQYHLNSSAMSGASSSLNHTILQSSSPYLGSLPSPAPSLASTPAYGQSARPPPRSDYLGEPKGPFAADGGVDGAKQISGDKEVDDDIAAFYKAKEELLKRNGARK